MKCRSTWLPIAKQVMGFRSFGERVESLSELKEAINFHAANAVPRLRKQGLYANEVSVFIPNSPFDQVEFHGGDRDRGPACSN
jgi:DNA polymerase V